MKKIAAIGLAAAALTGILAGCGAQETASGGAQSAAAQTAAKTMTFADSQCPTSLDPADGWSSWYTSRYGITETLFVLDQNLAAQNWLAESAEALDDTTWKITLRDDVTFHNGNPLTAQSVIDCWTRTMEKNARLNELLYIDKMEADGQVLTIKTTKPVPAFLSSLCEPVSGIIDVSSVNDPALLPIGTGPYQAKSYEVKKQCVVERYDNYWGGKPALESATFQIIADTSALAMAQQTGESDVSLTIPAASLSLFENDSRFVVDGAVGSRGQVLYLNFENKNLQDINVRKAISMAIDKENYASVLNKNASVPANGLFPDNVAFGGKELNGYSFDLEGAKKLLAEAGYADADGDGILEKDGERLALTLSTYSTKAELPVYSEAMKSAFQDIGIDLTLDLGTYDTIVEKQKNGQFDLMLISFTMSPTGDPQYFSDIAFKTGGSANYGKYSNAEVDKLIDQLDQEFDTEKRNALAKEIQQKILDDAGFVVIGHAKFTNVLKASVQNCETNPSEYYLLNAKTTMSE